ncbi:MAG TPA: primosomal protein N' [Deferrisomatales bacterium]|nr:primosomal protein N' [Deferrisomatales bacterium]
MATGPFARVAVARPLQHLLHYRIPAHLATDVAPGVRCVVPLGKARCVGFVVTVDPAAGTPEVRELLDVLDPTPCLPADLLHLGLWLAAYYHYPPGEALATLLPPGQRAGAEVCYRAGGREDPPAQAVDHGLWEHLRRGGELVQKQLKEGQYQVLTRLVSSGHAVREWVVSPPPALRPQVWYRLAAGCPDSTQLEARAPRQAEVLAALAGGERSVAELRRAGVEPAALRRLERRDWVLRRELPPLGMDPRDCSFPDPGCRPELSGDQQRAVAAAEAGLAGGGFSTILLRGVTGSGKTEVYIRAAEAARRAGRGVVVLVPEIGLTPQMLGRFLAVFGDQVAVLHSGLGARERRIQWRRVRDGEAPVVLGARSAVFAPVPDLGLVVVDEEHEASYKQDDGLRYHAKHAALVRARHCGAVALLGSATPDLESHWNGERGRYQELVLPRRVGGAQPPVVHVVDLRQEEGRRRSRVLLSEPLRAAVDAALPRGEQILFYLNRRGFSPALVCRTCGQAVACGHCTIALTLHRTPRVGLGELVCHYCGHRRPAPPSCPHCEAAGLVPAGIGTQQLVDAVGEAWPGARVVRLDRDAVRRASGAEVLGPFHRGEAEILVGTQMVAKGHHFPRLTVVGVIDADLSLNFPDFRATERTFQVLTQVAGRAGREERPGMAFLQTRNPYHPALTAAVAGDFDAFARQELVLREEAGFPPFRRLALVRTSSPDEAAARGAAQSAAETATALLGRHGGDLLGPAPAPVERIRGRWRYHVLLRAPGPDPAPLQRVLRGLLAAPAGHPAGNVQLVVDVDPVNLL